MKSLTILLCVFFYSVTTAQNFTITNQAQNIAYPGISNPLKCTVNNFSPDSIDLFTDNGKIIRESDGQFSFIPKHAGPTYIQVWAISKSEKIKIGEYPFRVRNLPNPIAYIGVQQSGSITVPKLITMGGIRATMHPDLGFDAPVRVVSYEVIGMANDICLFRFSNVGPVWSDESKQLLLSLYPTNAILFHQIYIQMPDGTTVKANEIYLTIE